VTSEPAPRFSQSPLAKGAYKQQLPPVSLGIRVKLIGLMVATTSLIVMALVSYFPARQVSELRAGLRERAVVYARLASQQLRSSVAFNDQETAREVLSAVARDPLIDGIAVYTEQGTRLHGEGSLSQLAERARGGFSEPQVFALPGRVLATAPVISLEGPKGTVVLELSTRSATQARDRLVRVALVAGLAAVVLGTLLAWLIARSLAERVERVAEAATQVAQGDLEQKLPIDGTRDEIGVLSHGFNAMVGQLRGLIIHIRASAREESARLERLVRERTLALDQKNRDLKLVLDNVDQGFVTIDREGVVVGEHSRVIDTWLGTLDPGALLWAYIDRSKPGVHDNFRVSWTEVIDGVLPLELTLEQMPKQLAVKGRYLRLEYKPLGGDDFDKLLVILSDVTALVERERSEQEERDILNVASRVLQDRAGFLEFFAETEQLLRRVCENRGDAVTLKRDLHTLKGNSAIYGLSRLSELCHGLESELESVDAATLDRSSLSEQWSRVCEKLKLVLGQHDRPSIEVNEQDYLAVLDAIHRGVDPLTLRRMIEAWRLEPMQARLERVAEQISATAQRLGKGAVDVEVKTPRLFLSRDELAEFWTVFSHVVRNAAVHGLELPEDRQRMGKAGAFRLSAGIERGQLFVELRDSGPGIDWARVRERAAEHGLPTDTQLDLERALFSDGISTAASVDELAGRGVGLSAVREVCLSRRGNIAVSSVSGQGASFKFSWPVSEFKSLSILEAGAA
jgi:two-component system chemotaxis sensor kinase CheA